MTLLVFPYYISHKTLRNLWNMHRQFIRFNRTSDCFSYHCSDSRTTCHKIKKTIMAVALRKDYYFYIFFLIAMEAGSENCPSCSLVPGGDSAGTVRGTLVHRTLRKECFAPSETQPKHYPKSRVPLLRRLFYVKSKCI